MAYATLLVSVLLGAFAQVCLKKGMLQVGGASLLELLRSPGRLLGVHWLYLGGGLYAASLLLWLSVLSRIELSKAYPMVSIGYLVTFLLGVILFQESASAHKIGGLLLVMAGVVLLARG